MTQAHLSQIENGNDLRLSTLVDILGALDLELEIMPRKAANAFRAIARHARSAGPAGTATFSADDEVS